MRWNWLKFMGGVILMAGIIGGCDNQDTIGEEKILGYLENFTSLHPTENLMDFFDKEGVRDEHFRTSDKGVWYLNTSINEQKEDIVYIEGMHLRLNRNTGEGEGYFYKRQRDELKLIDEERYPVVYDEDGFHLVEDIDDPVLEEKILNFQFVVQYISLDGDYLNKLETLEVVYNSNRPLYQLYYELPKNDPNVQRIIDQYPNYVIELTENPGLRLRGNGTYEGGNLSDRSMIIYLDEDRNLRLNSRIYYGSENGDEG